MAVVNGNDLRADEHLAARQALVTLHHPEMGPERHSGSPLRMSRTPLATPRPAPRLGEHSHQVLASWLGIDEPGVAELVATGVCC
jgi:crotonobetainyl-CoA:carnitine CoA-transferase CaiB-like acyl-CoA transferase